MFFEVRQSRVRLNYEIQFISFAKTSVLICLQGIPLIFFSWFSPSEVWQGQYRFLTMCGSSSFQSAESICFCLVLLEHDWLSKKSSGALMRSLTFLPVFGAMFFSFVYMCPCLCLSGLLGIGVSSRSMECCGLHS